MKTSPRVAVVLLALLLPACFESFKERGRQIEKVGQDKAVLERASGAVNQVIYNLADCDAVKAALPEAQQRLNEANGAVREEASRATLDALRIQLKRASDACP